MAGPAIVCLFVAGVILNDREISALRRVWKEAAVSWFAALP